MKIRQLVVYQIRIRSPATWEAALTKIYENYPVFSYSHFWLTLKMARLCVSSDEVDSKCDSINVSLRIF